MKRIKLFSNPTPRIKLFSEDKKKTVACSDCGYRFKTFAHTTNLLCPKCGGTRFNIVPDTLGPENDEEIEWQKEFSETSNEFEIKLREFSGHKLSGDKIQKEFGITAEEMNERGFSDILEDGMSKIHDDAFIQSRLFSSLVISVTKTLDLDPTVVCGKPEDSIARLEEISDLCPKSIMILKRAHGISECPESWATDSGILGDLKLEMGGTSRPLPEFKKIINERYPDAPEGILDFLERKGIIKPSGENKIEIIK